MGCKLKLESDGQMANPEIGYISQFHTVALRMGRCAYFYHMHRKIRASPSQLHLLFAIEAIMFFSIGTIFLRVANMMLESSEQSSNQTI